MRFVLVVLTIHFVLEVVARKKVNRNRVEGSTKPVIEHPAEYNLR
jgi:hypothetical protein